MGANCFKLNANKTKVLTVGTAERLSRMNCKLKVTMDDVQLEGIQTGHEKLLGVSLTANLKWTDHVRELTSKLKVKLAALDKLKFIMRRVDKKKIVQGVFNSVLCYCLPLFGGCNTAELDTLQSLQNRAARIVLNLPSLSHRQTMFEELKWMTIRQLVAYHTLLPVYRIRVSGQPEYLASLLTKENARGQILVRNSRLELYRKSFIPRGSNLWNKLPVNIRTMPTLASFKKAVRKWIDHHVNMFEN